MDPMHQLAPNHPHLRSLFAAHRHLPAIRQTVLEGRLGRAWGNDPQAPTTARLDLGCYAIFGGNPAADGAEELLDSVKAPKELVYPDDIWRQRILERHGSRLHDRPMDSFVADQLDSTHLQMFAAGFPEGYRLERLESSTAAQLDNELEPNGLQTYATPEALTTQGLAWGAFTREPQPRLASVASSYTRSRRSVEVAIATHPQHRGRGLAGAVAARFCLEVLELKLEPCWNAANPVSKRLARRLGFRPGGVCEILFLEAP